MAYFKNKMEGKAMTKKLLSYKLKNAEFVAGEDELCFQCVIDDFPKAEYINILTYNISSKSDYLLNAIRRAASRDIPINIITNIPNRWPQYWKNSYKDAARKNINLYQKRLDPKALGKLASVFFKFNNHGKVIMTNNIIYWGSSNYSDESKRNFECGTISTDKEFIGFVSKNIIGEIIHNATSYYSVEYNKCLLSMFSAISIINNKREEIFEASFDYDNDYETNFEDRAYFNPFDNYLTWDLLESFLIIIADFDGLLQELQDELTEKEDAYNMHLDNLVNEYQANIANKNAEIADFCKQIKPLASFNEQDYIEDLLQGEYYPEAYDENLDYYAQLAFERGREKKAEYIEKSEKSINALLKALDEYENDLLLFIDKVMKIAKVNETIDNT